MPHIDYIRQFLATWALSASLLPSLSLLMANYIMGNRLHTWFAGTPGSRGVARQSNQLAGRPYRQDHFGSATDTGINKRPAQGHAKVDSLVNCGDFENQTAPAFASMPATRTISPDDVAKVSFDCCAEAYRGWRRRRGFGSGAMIRRNCPVGTGRIFLPTQDEGTYGNHDLGIFIWRDSAIRAAEPV